MIRNNKINGINLSYVKFIVRIAIIYYTTDWLLNRIK